MLGRLGKLFRRSAESEAPRPQDRSAYLTFTGKTAIRGGDVYAEMYHIDDALKAHHKEQGFQDEESKYRVHGFYDEALVRHNLGVLEHKPRPENSIDDRFTLTFEQLEEFVSRGVANRKTREELQKALDKITSIKAVLAKDGVYRDYFDNRL
jgi:hypothetical protein